MSRLVLFLFALVGAEETFSDSGKFERWSHFKDYGVPAVMGKDEVNSAAIADSSCRMIEQSQGFSLWLYPERVKRVLNALANAPPTSNPSYFVFSVEKMLRDACTDKGDRPARPEYKLDSLAASVQNWYHALVAPSSDPSWHGKFDPAYQPQQVALTAGFICIVAADLNDCELSVASMSSLATRASDLRNEFSSEAPWQVGSTRFSNASSMEDLARSLRPLVSGSRGGLCRCDRKELVGEIPKTCPSLQAVYTDIHDGDQKEVQISGTSLVIKPSGNNQTWVVQSTIDLASCSASVNFNVKGKPNPPPVNLQATLWFTFSSQGKKTEFGFTDPSGTLASPSSPLNRWVEEAKTEIFVFPCIQSLNAVFADIHDGDQKEVSISGTSLVIQPTDNNQVWTVKSTIDLKSCSAIVDFNVPGKPNPPLVKLRLTLMNAFRTTLRARSNFEIEFTDPSGKLAAPATPLNYWVQVRGVQNNNIIVL